MRLCVMRVLSVCYDWGLSGLSQSSFTKGPGRRARASLGRQWQGKTPSLAGRNLEQNQASEG